MVLSGAPGIGKTVLLEHGATQAAAGGRRVLTCRAVEAEAGLAFTGLSDLLTPVLDEALPALVPPRRTALAVALLLEEPGSTPPQRGAIGLAVMDCLRELARTAPVVVNLDDVQWLDTATATVLPVALRRLRDQPSRRSRPCARRRGCGRRSTCNGPSHASSASRCSPWDFASSIGSWSTASGSSCPAPS
jgi:hypothetical protein